MHIAGRITIGIASAMLLASAALAGSRSDLGKAAERLEEQARVAAAHGDTVSQSYSTDAHELARRAERFRSDVETQTVSDADVSAQFHKVAESYHRFREQVRLANTQQALADLDAVTGPYRDVEENLGIRHEADAG